MVKPFQVVCFLVVIVGLSQGYSLRTAKCPIPNVCIWGCDSIRKAIHCSDSLLGPYSPELPSKRANIEDIWSADFSQNSISIIQNLSFYNHHYEVIKMRTLNYSTNVITTIEPEAFAGLDTYLHTLILDNNLLEFIPVIALQNLTKLHFLSLNNNRLSSIDFVCLNSLLHLHKLSVANNEIQDISPTCFYGTRLGKTEDSSLIFRGNKLRYLNACTFQGRKFQTLDYSNNSYMCMCEMAWLHNYLLTNVENAVGETEECFMAEGYLTNS
ncbi:hypothetical protein EB796_000215 [Bugula neritina]|uniref:Uncharacterized protein n=1 Tax=Bugula neritina TaxID=10212 RepID=A0A7J7KTL2_BUGNE|nr:hypothetical protein EB796_000215 [Bugula neritina]